MKTTRSKALLTWLVLPFAAFWGSSLSAQAAPITWNFDAVTAPALPAGFTTTGTGSGALWVTTSAVADTPPNSAFAPDVNSLSDKSLVTPVFTPDSGATVTFRHQYGFENNFDGGVLEISINGAAFQDIIAAGGSFVSGGYTTTISSAFSSPIAGRQAWSGSQASFMTTQVNLPPAAFSQPTQLRFRLATDTSVGSTGWWVDTIVVSSAGGPPSAASVTPVPTIGEYALLALMALVAGAAAFGRRHRA